MGSNVNPAPVLTSKICVFPSIRISIVYFSASLLRISITVLILDRSQSEVMSTKFLLRFELFEAFFCIRVVMHTVEI